jgi:2-methylisocitrate lyase-like PEP mutase family enzyme
MTAQSDRARRFRSLHDAAAPLALANAWDGASARLVEATGAPAVATTSAGVAWSLGAADGDQLDRDQAMAAIARIVASVSVPVTADIETGFGDTAAEVGETIKQVIAAGAVGVNLEDVHPESMSALRPTLEQAERIAAARAAADSAGIPLFINARIDAYLRGVGPESTRFQETLDRASAYLEAGADGIFVPGVTDQAVITSLTEGIAAPVNILVEPGSPTVAELSKCGVARVSLGSAVAEAAYAVVRRTAEQLITTGTYATQAESVDYQDFNDLMHSSKPAN